MATKKAFINAANIMLKENPVDAKQAKVNPQTISSTSSAHKSKPIKQPVYGQPTFPTGPTAAAAMSNTGTERPGMWATDASQLHQQKN